MLDVFGTAQGLVYWALLATSLGIKGYAMVDVARRRADAFPLAGKRTKNLWMAIVGVAFAVNFILLNPLSFLNIIGSVAAIVYLVDVRPAVAQVEGHGRGGQPGQHMGPYGPW